MKQFKKIRIIFVVLSLLMLVLFSALLLTKNYSKKTFSYKTKAFESNITNDENLIFPDNIGVSHVCGAYPNRQIQEDLLTFGAKNAIEQGFQSIEVFMYPQNLCTPGAWQASHPKGCYQTYKYCHQGWTIASSLKSLAMENDFQTLFDLPIKNMYYPLMRLTNSLPVK